MLMRDAIVTEEEGIRMLWIQSDPEDAVYGCQICGREGKLFHPVDTDGLGGGLYAVLDGLVYCRSCIRKHNGTLGLGDDFIRRGR